jgi:hypothetical protein
MVEAFGFTGQSDGACFIHFLSETTTAQGDPGV